MKSYANLSDEELTLLLKDRDQIAFAEVYERYWRIIYGHVYKMLLDEEEAKDILQEVFSSVWLKSGDFPANINLAGYLFVSAKNRVLNFIRKNKTQDAYITSLAKYVDQFCTSTMDQLDERDVAAAIEREIQSLPKQMREVFELSRKECLSYKEIAIRLGISEETVKKQIYNAIKRMRIGLKDAVGSSIAILIFLR